VQGVPTITASLLGITLPEVSAHFPSNAFGVNAALCSVTRLFREGGVDGRKSTCGKRVFLRHYYILEMIILPRQAREKHRENSKRDACSYRSWQLDPELVNSNAHLTDTGEAAAAANAK
jgi:hypothetical protein